MKYIWQLELKDGTTITTGDPWKGKEGLPVSQEVELEDKTKITLPVTVFAIRYVPDIEIDVTDDSDDLDEDIPAVVQRIPAHYELLSYMQIPNGQGMAWNEMDVIPAVEVRRERQKRDQKDIAKSIREWVAEADSGNEADDAPTQAQAPTNGTTRPGTESATS